MDIDIDVNQLSAETRELLLRFQVANLHYITREDFYDIPGESDWLVEFSEVKSAFKDCPELQIADVGRKLDFNKACEETDEEGENLVDAGKLDPDDYQSWFDSRLDERCKEITEIENALYRLSLRVGDRRTEFWRIIN